ncbi:MAG TPA: protein kinase, partial [Polyangiaceae bacterium]|nr:protein kinase [Polyangiaceae bacterium]
MLRPGEVIDDDFEVLENLGQGGMGAVFLVRQRSTEALRALKVMLPRWIANDDFRARFALEAKASARIASEHVVEVIAAGVDDTRHAPWLVMEYLRGATLADWAASAGFPTGAALGELLLQLFHGVSAAHTAGIVHRDLKPQNLFIADSQRAGSGFTLKILDFGIAKLLEHGEFETQALGTRAWMSPEQDRPGAHITPSADVWALGLIVFWLLTGRSYWLNSERGGAALSFELQFADLPRASLRALEHGLPALGAEFDAWFARTLAREPSQRYPNARECWQALRPLVDALATRGPATVPLAETAPLPSSTRALPASGVADRRRESRPTRTYNLPQPSQSFVGREVELEDVRAELERGDVRLCAAVEGLPGVGKTELVLQLAHRLAASGRFPGGIFWLPAEARDLTRTWASESIAGALGIGGSAVLERARAVVHALSRASAPLLVILDNVEDWSETVRPLPLPEGVHVTLLVTTRRRRLGGARFRPFTLGVLSPDEARELLVATAGAGVTGRPGFRELLAHLDGHALAVELAGAHLSEFPEVTPADYLAALDAGGELEGDAAHLTRYERTVDDAFELLWRRLDDRVQGFWQLAAQFAPEPVSSELSNQVGLDATARRELRRFHLIDADANGAWRMHRMTRAYGLRAGDGVGRLITKRRFVEGAGARIADIIVGSGFEKYLMDRVHFDTAARLVPELPHTAESSHLLASVATALHSTGEFEAARRHFQQALDLDLEHLGEAHERVASGLADLSLVVQDLGALDEACALLDRAIALDLAYRSDA